MDFIDILREKAFLGREFLTWLWFKSDRNGGTIDLEGARTVEVYFLDRMVLDMTDVETPQTVSLKGEHSGLREGLAALREGKKIEEARICIRSGDNEFTMALKGTWFNFGGFKTPPVLPTSEDEEGGPEAAFLEKAYLIGEGMELVDALFSLFLKVRISDTWDARELPALRKWVATGGE